MKIFLKNILKNNLYLNVQSNSNNYGFNLFDKYKKFSYLSINLKEFQLNFKKKITSFNEIKNLIIKKRLSPMSVTLGHRGSLFVNKKNKLFYCPNFYQNPTDTTGCGDAYFIMTSFLVNLGFDDEIVPFLGNIYAGLHSKNFGNSKVPDKKELLKAVGVYFKYLMNKLISIAKKRCINYRVKLLEMSQRVSAIHLGGTFSSTEILDAIYNILMKKNERENFILSKGHCSALQYVILKDLKVLSENDLRKYSKSNGKLGVHPEVKNEGLNASTGSLGQGLSMAAGFALSNRKKNVYVVLSDGLRVTRRFHLGSDHGN